MPHFHHLKFYLAFPLLVLWALGSGGIVLAQQGASASRDARESSRPAAAQSATPRTPDAGRTRPAAPANASQGAASPRPTNARQAQAAGGARPAQGASRRAPPAPTAASAQTPRRTAASAQKSRGAAAPRSAQPVRTAARPQVPGTALAATAAGALSTAALAQPDRVRPGPQISLPLHSSVALVVDQQSGEVLLGKNPREVLPIASITKLMTAMVVLDARQRLDEPLRITREDIDTLRHSGSRLHPGVRLTRGEMLQLALMASENRAANALGRHYPGGMAAFVSAMNAKAQMIGMHDSRFVEPTGLSSRNVSNGHDLARLVREAWNYPLIRQYSVARSMSIRAGQQSLGYFNTNRLVSTQGWAVGLQKTGYISDSGNCLVMQARIDGRPLIFVLLDADGAMARFGDAQRIRSWLLNPSGGRYTQSRPPSQALASAGS